MPQKISKYVPLKYVHTKQKHITITVSIILEKYFYRQHYE